MSYPYRRRRYVQRRPWWRRFGYWQRHALYTILLVGGGFAYHGWQALFVPQAEAFASEPRIPSNSYFEICKSVRDTCVVDGDTFWLKGVKIRIADIDTPEISEPSCASEKQLGEKAKYRLRELLNAGPFQLAAWEGRDEDKYGRKLRVVLRDGKSLGDQLVSEGLARTWTGRREPWC
jgi:endonuclease YncB( thermonuclease family)